MKEQPQQEPVAVPTDPPASDERAAGLEPDLIEEDLLIEDVSIDGMCGVY